MTTDALLAAELARGAGEELLAVRSSGLDGEELRRAGDAQAQAWLSRQLAAASPHDAVLSEEAHDDLTRLVCDRVWILDPLDGTREFSEPGRTDWAVHVALWSRTSADSGELTAAAVGLPATGTVMTTAPPPAQPAAEHHGPLRLLVSRTRASALVTELGRVLDAQLVPMGSAGAKAMAVVRGDADVYAHSGGQYEWDSAAPVAVAAAAGLHVSRLDGSPLTYNAPNPWLPDVLICAPHLAAHVLDALREAQHHLDQAATEPEAAGR